MEIQHVAGALHKTFTSEENFFAGVALDGMKNQIFSQL